MHPRGGRRSSGLPPARQRCSAFWSDGEAVHLALHAEDASELLVISLPCPERRFPVRRPSRTRRPCDWSGRSVIFTAWSPRALPIRAAGSITVAGACAGLSDAQRGGYPPPGIPYVSRGLSGPPLHQIPVGPVHAGIIEPGHFRFTCNGEAVVRLEERLGYVHKGIDGLMLDAPLEKAAKLTAACRATARSPMPSPSPAPSRRHSVSSRRRARSSCAR